jgi:hypothetical protein
VLDIIDIAAVTTNLKDFIMNGYARKCFVYIEMDLDFDGEQLWIK